MIRLILGGLAGIVLLGALGGCLIAKLTIDALRKQQADLERGE
jgi:hypothetical protein